MVDKRKIFAAASALTAVAGLTVALQLSIPEIELTAAPTTPPAVKCDRLEGNGNVKAPVDGPTTSPAGAVVVPAGDNKSLEFDLRAANTTFYFESGVHTLGASQYDQIQPGNNSTFIGAPGAIIDGNGVNRYAFTAQNADVTIKYLVIRDFTSTAQEGVVNHDAGARWTVENNSIVDNGGAALMGSDGGVYRNNCLKSNGQYGLNACCGEMIGLLVEFNEFWDNNTAGEPSVNCGCTGTMKFWQTTNSVVKDNWIHGNHGVGVWFDGNNAGATIEGNLIEDNNDEAIFFEQSYNGVIKNNTLRRNTWVKGHSFSANNDFFPIGTVYISEAGFDSRTDHPVGAVDFRVEGNVLENNWGGITVWENADRFCNSPANTSAGHCTLVNDAVTLDTCDAGTFGTNGENKTEPYYTDCRWQTKNVNITGNTFRSDPTAITNWRAGYSGLSGLFSQCGSSPTWSPYKGAVRQKAVTFDNNNKWANNTYEGDWQFVAVTTNRRLTWAEWQNSTQQLDCLDPGSGTLQQDVGSTMNGTTPPPPPPTTTTTTAEPPPVTTTTTNEPPPPPPALSTLDVVVIELDNGLKLVCPVELNHVTGDAVTCTFK